MEREEKIKKLMDKTGACREDVENALNACQDDILDAAMYLEALGKVNPMARFASSDSSGVNAQNSGGDVNSCSTGNSGLGEVNNNGYAGGNNAEKVGNSFASGIGRILKGIGDIIGKGMVNYMDIYKDGNCVFSIPITILVILFIPFFWFMLVLLVVFLFCGFRYEFRGPNCKKDGKANDALNKASDTCNSVKEDFMRGYNSNKNDNN